MTPYVQHYTRNEEIVRRYRAGEQQTALAKLFGISQGRVTQLVARWRKWHVSDTPTSDLSPDAF